MALKLSRIIQKGLQNQTDFIRIILNLPKFIKLYFRLFQDRRVQLHLKLILIFALSYLVSPIDLIPDWVLPLVGYADDLIVLFVALRYFLKNCPPEVVREHVERIERGE
jgi:uncharacterized membrane protein YkvA (DUF1232 family)